MICDTDACAVRWQKCAQERIVFMATPSDRTKLSGSDKQKGGGKDKQKGTDNGKQGDTREPLSELRATVSQLLKEVGQPREASSRSQAAQTPLSLVSVSTVSQ